MTRSVGVRRGCYAWVLWACLPLGCSGEKPGLVVGQRDSGAEPDGDPSPNDRDPTADKDAAAPAPRTPVDAGMAPIPLVPTDAGATASCGGVDCGLHGDCVVDEMGAPSCVCDKGYVAQAQAGEDGACVEDKTCVAARMLACRWSGGSAIHTHFSLSYCSGNPYVGLDVGDLLVDEKGNEDFEPLLPSESSATIMPHEFTAHVYVVLDISNSIQQSDVLDEVADGVRSLLDSLEQQGGRYRFALYLFDGKPYLYEFIEDTGDLGAARTALDGLVAQMGKDPSSSNVYGAVIEGVHKIDRAQALRSQVSQYGVLTTGTLIVISDGDDRSSTRTFADAEAVIAGTVSSVITVGLGDVANYPKLTSIGRDGSFSATEPALIGTAFDQIAERIELVGKSLYFFGYCTPTRKGDFTVRIGVKGFDFDRPTCSFNADGFVGLCDASTFDRSLACADRECGGPACGECPAGSCCYGGTCIAPGKLAEDATCGTEWHCETGLTCSAEKCMATVAPDAACGAELCDLELNYCGVPEPPPDPVPPPTCQPARPLDSPCKKGVECASLHCGIDPDYPTAPTKYCLPPAEMFSPCAGGEIACEPGSYCDGTVCKPQTTGGSCMTSQECMSGNCMMIGSGSKLCGTAPTCLFSHDML